MVLKTWDFDGLIIEQVYKPKDEETDDEGDDSSTIFADELEAAEERLNALFSEHQSFVSHDRSSTESSEILIPEPVSIHPFKLAPIAEEIPSEIAAQIPVNGDAEEQYEGAVGLWGQDYQLPCFQNGFQQPTVHRMEYQKSSFVPSVNVTNGFDFTQLLAPTTVAPPAPVKQCKTFEELVKMSDETLIFTKEPADCEICRRELEAGRGIMLKDCLHTFCRRCLVDAIENKSTPMMMCPAKQFRCESEVRDDEVKELLSPEAYKKYVHDTLVKMEINDLTELYESYDFVENKNNFRCEICLKDIMPGDGIVLKNCIHQYCKPCMGQYIETCDEAVVPCPFRNEDGDKCVGTLYDSELRSLVPDGVYLGFLRKSLAQAEATNPNAYHCKTPDCAAWVEIDADVEGFLCETCKRENCVKCKAVHQGVTCADFQEMTQGPSRRARENALTDQQVKRLIDGKDAQPCPRCNILTQRIDGCRHMTCTNCKHEFQWMGNDLNGY